MLVSSQQREVLLFTAHPDLAQHPQYQRHSRELRHFSEI